MANMMNTEYGGGDLQNEYNRILMQRTPRANTAQYDPTRALQSFVSGVVNSPEAQAISNMVAGATDTGRLLMERMPVGAERLLMQRTPIANAADTGRILVQRTPIAQGKGNAVAIPQTVIDPEHRYFLNAPGWAWPEDMEGTTGQAQGGNNPANVFASKNVPTANDYLQAMLALKYQ